MRPSSLVFGRFSLVLKVRQIICRVFRFWDPSYYKISIKFIRNKETGDYDDYGPYQSAATKESKKKEQRRNRRKNRGKNRGKLDKTDKGKNKAQIALTTVQTTMLSTIKTTEKQQQTTSIFILPMVTTTQRPTTQRPTTLAMITTKKSVNRERVYNLKSFFENET